MEKKIGLDGRVLKLNKQAMDFLHSEEFEKSIKTLKECEKLLNDYRVPKSNDLWGITYNNFGCLYKKVGNVKAALFYLTRAAEMEIRNGYDATNLASTHLNISAILSSVNNHEGSLVHALAALKTLQAFVSNSVNYSVSTVIAYHSIGVENEHLRKYTEALAAYKKGWEVAEKELGPDHKLTETLKKSFGKGCNLPTMPVIKSKKRYSKKRTSHNCNTFLPLVSSKNSQKTSFTSPKYTPLNKSSEAPHTRKSYYMHTRHSLSPIGEGSKNRLANEIESINKLIKELDGSGKKIHLENRKILNKKLEIPIRIQPIKSRKINYKDVVPSILKIQRWWRSLLYRFVAKPQKTQVVKIQKPLTEPSIRKKLLRPIPESKFEKKIDAIVKIQSFVRMWRQRKRYQAILNSIVLIQKHFRRYHTRKLYKLILSAIIFIQSVFRGHSTRKRLLNQSILKY